jgi:hypothetical protein
MTDQAPAPLYGDAAYDHAAGLAAMALIKRPRWKFAVHDGGRRMLGERAPRPTLDLKIVKETN